MEWWERVEKIPGGTPDQRAICVMETALDVCLSRFLVQGIGGGFLFANSTAILTDAFSVSQRGMAMGINQIAAILGSINRVWSARGAVSEH